MTSAGDLWGSFAHDPRDLSVAPLRASDADREIVHGVLAEAFADGRLDREEYDERTAAVLVSRTLGQLPPLVADLVPDRPLVRSDGRVPLTAATSADLQRRAVEHWREERRNAFLGFLGPTLICWTIWAVTTPGGFPWPIFVSAFTLLHLLRTAAGKGQIVAAEVRRLEKRRARALESREQEPGADT